MTVKNINGTSDNPKCPCGSWIKHWKNYALVKDPYCSVAKCAEKGEHGAHVQMKDVNDDSWYIIPLCHKHNMQRDQEFEVDDHVDFIPVTDRRKCGQ